MRRNIVFLCSGGGGNLRFIQAAIAQGWLERWTLGAVIADRECAALAYARSQGLDAREIDFRVDKQRLVEEALQELDPAAIVTNVHRILSKEIVRRFDGRLINLHYSLLPAFGGVIGVRAVDEALAYGERIVGVTAHYLVEQVDKGAPITQIAIPVHPGDTLEALMDIQFRAGAIALLAALAALGRGPAPGAKNGLSIAGRQCIVSPAAAVPEGLYDEAFWARLK